MNIVELKKKIDAFAFGRSISLTIDLGTVYVLLLKKDKLYVGFTLNPERKINAHLKPSLMYKNPHINTWIGMNSYPAKTLISKFDQVDKSFENDLTQYLMITYGINNVRGGKYTRREDYKQQPSSMSDFCNLHTDNSEV